MKGICNILQNLRFAQLSVDEIVGVGGPDNPLGIKCGSEIAWYKKGHSKGVIEVSLWWPW